MRVADLGSGTGCEDLDQTILYVGPFTFPTGQAGSRRVLGNALTIAASGRQVLVLHGEADPGSPEQLPESARIAHLGMAEIATGLGPVAKATRVLFAWGAKTTRWLDEQPGLPKAVVLYGGYASYFSHLRSWTAQRGVPLIVDVVEWYGREQFGGILGTPLWISASHAFQRYQQADGVIAISGLLSEHFSRLPVVQIPPTLDTSAVPVGRQRRGAAATKLVYAGVPGPKDALLPVIETVGRMNRDGIKVTLDVLGPSAQELNHLAGGALPRGVEALGRLAHHDALKRVANADFSLLLRPSTRFNNAGFPTKLVESMSCGTPAIATITSDLGQYLTDGQNALVTPDITVGSVVEAIERAVQLTPDDLADMSARARETATQHFDYRRYITELDDFLTRIA